jgi:hypothetical protein
MIGDSPAEPLNFSNNGRPSRIVTLGVFPTDASYGRVVKMCGKLLKPSRWRFGIIVGHRD